MARKKKKFKLSAFISGAQHSGAYKYPEFNDSMSFTRYPPQRPSSAPAPRRAPSRSRPAQTAKRQLQKAIAVAKGPKLGRKRRECETPALIIDFSGPEIEVRKYSIPCSTAVISYSLQIDVRNYAVSGSMVVVSRGFEEVMHLIEDGIVEFSYDYKHTMLCWINTVIEHALVSQFGTDEEAKRFSEVAESRMEYIKQGKMPPDCDFAVDKLIKLLTSPPFKQGYTSMNNGRIIKQNNRAGTGIILQGGTVISPSYLSFSDKHPTPTLQ